MEEEKAGNVNGEMEVKNIGIMELLMPKESLLIGSINWIEISRILLP